MLRCVLAADSRSLSEVSDRNLASRVQNAEEAKARRVAQEREAMRCLFEERLRDHTVILTNAVLYKQAVIQYQHQCWRWSVGRFGQMSKASYEFTVEVLLPFEAAEQRTRELLKDEGFGVLTEIDVRRTLKDKLGEDFRPYRILGACNPHLAHQALNSEPGIGVLLPCNVVIEEAAAGTTRVRFLEPIAALGVVGNPALEPVAKEASERLHRVAESLVKWTSMSAG